MPPAFWDETATIKQVTDELVVEEGSIYTPGHTLPKSKIIFYYICIIQAGLGYATETIFSPSLSPP